MFDDFDCDFDCDNDWDNDLDNDQDNDLDNDQDNDLDNDQDNDLDNDQSADLDNDQGADSNSSSWGESFMSLLFWGFFAGMFKPTVKRKRKNTNPKNSLTEKFPSGKPLQSILLKGLCALPVFAFLVLHSMVFPAGVNKWAALAGHLCLFSFLLIPAPFSILLGIIALHSLGKNPEEKGYVRSWLAILFGLLGSVGLCGALYLYLGFC